MHICSSVLINYYLLSFILHPNHERHYGRKYSRIIYASYHPARHRKANLRHNLSSAFETKCQRCVHSLQSGNEKLVHIFLTAQHEVHNALPTTPFLPPPNPGINLVIPDAATGHQISSLRRNHDNLLEEFNTCDQDDKALKSLAIATF